MKSKVIFRSNPIKYLKIDLSLHELLIISISVVGFNNFIDHIYVSVILNFSNIVLFSIIYKSYIFFIVVVIIIAIIDGNHITHDLVLNLFLTPDHMYYLHTTILFIFTHQTTSKRYEAIQNSESVIIIHSHLHFSNQAFPSRNQFLVTRLMDPPRQNKIVNM